MWLAARFELCGLSGCGGGGFGRSYSPRAVLVLLLLSGLAAAAGHVLGRPAQARGRLVTAAVLLVVVPVLGGVVIGAGPDGYPRSVSPETRERELERQEERRS